MKGRPSFPRDPERNRTSKERCKEFIRQTKTLDGARRLERGSGFSATTSLWLSAFSEILAERVL